MSNSQSYTWRPYNYQPVAPPPPPPMPILLAMPMLVAPCVAVPVKSAPLNDMKVAGSDTAAKGKELVTTTKTTAAIKGTSSKTVTKLVSKAASSAAKAPPKAVSTPASSAAKAPPSKPASSAPAKSTASKASKKSSSSATAAKTSATVVVSKTLVSASTSASKKSSAATASNASSKTTPSQKAAKLKAVTAPMPPLPGMKYIYPKHHTCLHVILRTRVWESPVPANVVAKTFYVPCVMTITELIEQLMGTEGDKCKGWALTEVQEKGDGVFVKGMSVEYGGDKAALALKGVGWNEKNGAERPPVWMVLHKI